MSYTEEQKAKKRVWREKNRERIKAQVKAYKESHKDEIRAYQKYWTENRPDRVLTREKKDVPCADCGTRYPYYVMQFDHVRGEKLFNISSARKVTLDQIREEIEKCDVVCANCHMERTHGVNKR